VVKHNTYTAVVVEENKIFGTKSMEHNTPYPSDIRSNSDDTKIYCLEWQHVQELKSRDDFQCIVDITYPDDADINKEVKIIEKECLGHKQIIYG
jgi:hypothetical protein